MLAALTAASVDQRTDDHSRDRDQQRDDEPQQYRRIRPVLDDRPEAEHEREQERKPAPFAGRGIAEADAGQEEEDISNDSPHGRFIP
jgi:hypothetical protein